MRMVSRQPGILVKGEAISSASMSAPSGSARRPLCRSCLDWSERLARLAGSLGKALLSSFLDKGWARRTAESRSILFSPEGDRQFLTLFPVDP